MDIPLIFQFALSKFRCNSFGLCVDFGKFNNIVYERRLCIFCLDNNLFFFEHQLHKQTDDLRNMYILPIANVDTGLPLTIILTNLMSSQNEHILLNLGKFLYCVYRL